MKTYILGATVLFLVACGRPPHTPVQGTKIAVVEFSVAPDAVIKRYGGNAQSLGMPLAEGIAKKVRDYNGLDAHAIAHTVPAEGDLTLRGEITHIDGGNTAVRWSVLVCTFCGWWTGSAIVGVQGKVIRRDGTVVGVFTEEKLANEWGEASSVLRATKAVAVNIGMMVRKGEYRGGHPGDHGYLADGYLPATAGLAATKPWAERLPAEPLPSAAQPAKPPPVAHAPAAQLPAERLRALENLRAQGLISDAEYTEKRKQILQEF